MVAFFFAFVLNLIINSKLSKKRFKTLYVFWHILALKTFYFKNILPAIGSFFSGTKAYHYLPESVDNFLSKHKLQTLLSEANFKGIENKDMTFGICTSFKATK